MSQKAGVETLKLPRTSSHYGARIETEPGGTEMSLRDDFTVEANQPEPSYKSLIMKPPGLLQLITLTLASDEERAEISPPINCVSLIALLGSRAAAMTDRRQKAAGRQMGSHFLGGVFLLF